MHTIVTRIYRSAAEAHAAAGALREQWYDPAAMVVTPDGATAAEARAALIGVGLSPAAATSWAAALPEGGSAVSVRAPFGKAVAAGQILERFGGLPPGAPGEHKSSTDNAAPFSAMLGLRVLINNPTPFSSWLCWLPLTPSQRPKAKLINNPAPLTDTFFTSPLCSNPAPLSRMFGLSLLSRAAAPLSRMLGMSVLSSQQRGKANLMKNPAPFSAMLGLPTLIRCR